MANTESLSEYVAGEVRATLARRRLTGKELASDLGVSRSWVSYRLTGTTEITLNDLQRIAAALEMELADLLPKPVRERLKGVYVASSERSAAKVRNVARRANRGSRMADARPHHPRPSWTDARVTA